MTDRTSLSFSVRRHFVDGFFKAHEDLYQTGTKVLDIGGRKYSKRGTFDIGSYPCTVAYVNIEPSSRPDILADATAIPLPDASFDVVVLGELLEHVPAPARVVAEAKRLLKPGGALLATVPFLYPVHGDPSDYGRYTEQYWRETLLRAGYGEIHIEPQGSWYALFALALQAYFRFPSRSRIGRLTGKLVGPFLHFLMLRDRSAGTAERTWTTGFGIVAKKR